MKVVLIMFKADERREFPMGTDMLTIGRSPQSALRIPTGDVSRNHCELEIEDGELIVHDLGSTNGTQVNGESVEEHTIKAGDRLTVGPVSFVVQIDGQPAEVNPSDVAISTGKAIATSDSADDTEEMLELSDLDLELDQILGGADDDDDDLP